MENYRLNQTIAGLEILMEYIDNRTETALEGHEIPEEGTDIPEES